MPETARARGVAPIGELDAVPIVAPNLAPHTLNGDGATEAPADLLCKKGTAAASRSRARAYDHKDTYEPARRPSAPPPDLEEPLGSWCKYDGPEAQAEGVSDEELPTSWCKYENKPMASLFQSMEPAAAKAPVRLTDAAPVEPQPEIEAVAAPSAPEPTGTQVEFLPAQPLAASEDTALPPLVSTTPDEQATAQALPDVPEAQAVEPPAISAEPEEAAAVDATPVERAHQSQPTPLSPAFIPAIPAFEAPEEHGDARDEHGHDDGAESWVQRQLSGALEKHETESDTPLEGAVPPPIETETDHTETATELDISLAGRALEPPPVATDRPPEAHFVPQEQAEPATAKAKTPSSAKKAMLARLAVLLERMLSAKQPERKFDVPAPSPGVEGTEPLPSPTKASAAMPLEEPAPPEPSAPPLAAPAPIEAPAPDTLEAGIDAVATEATIEHMRREDAADSETRAVDASPLEPAAEAEPVPATFSVPTAANAASIAPEVPTTPTVDLDPPSLAGATAEQAFEPSVEPAPDMEASLISSPTPPDHAVAPLDAGPSAWIDTADTALSREPPTEEPAATGSAPIMSGMPVAESAPEVAPVPPLEPLAEMATAEPVAPPFAPAAEAEVLLQESEALTEGDAPAPVPEDRPRPAEEPSIGAYTPVARTDVASESLPSLEPLAETQAGVLAPTSDPWAEVEVAPRELPEAEFEPPLLSVSPRIADETAPDAPSAEDDAPVSLAGEVEVSLDTPALEDLVEAAAAAQAAPAVAIPLVELRSEPIPPVIAPTADPIDEEQAAQATLASDLAEMIHDVLSTTKFATRATMQGRYASDRRADESEAEELADAGELEQAALPHPVTIRARLGRTERALAFASVGMTIAAGYFALALWRDDGSVAAPAPVIAAATPSSESAADGAPGGTREALIDALKTPTALSKTGEADSAETERKKSRGPPAVR